MSFLIKNYKFFYNLIINEKKRIFSIKELENLKKEYIVNDNYADILIFNWNLHGEVAQLVRAQDS